MDDQHPQDRFLVGGSLSHISVSLRVIGDSVEPEDITRLLGVQPAFFGRKGEKMSVGSTLVTQRTGKWVYEFSEEPSPEWDLGDALRALLGRLPSDLSAWRDLGKLYSLDIFCGLFLGSKNQGLSLDSSILAALADRGLTLQFDIYGPPSESQGS